MKSSHVSITESNLQKTGRKYKTVTREYLSGTRKIKVRKSRRTFSICWENLQVMSVVALGFTIMSYFAYQMLVPTVIDKLEQICQEHRTFDTIKLERNLNQRLFGQPLAIRAITERVKQFNQNSSQGPLVLSFHGSTGTGKTLASNIFSESLPPGSNTHRVFFSQPANSDFKNWIRNCLTSCTINLFVFEDIEKATKEQIRVLEEIWNLWASDEEIGNKGAIFILVSPIGEAAIRSYFLDTMSRGLTRNDVKKDELVKIMKYAMDEANVINSNFVSRFVMFLPLERVHLAKCARALIEKNESEEITNKNVEKILNYLPYEEDHPLVAKLGCKKVDSIARIANLS